MTTMRTSLALMVVGVLLGSLLLGSGCRKFSGSKAGASSSVTKPAPVVAKKPAAPKPPPVVATKPPPVVVTQAAEVVPPPAAPREPGFWARHFGSKPAQPAAGTAARTPAPKAAPVTVNVETNKSYVPYRIQINDTLLIALRSIIPEQPNIELVVDENGEIKLPYINSIKAEGQTTSELETIIRDTYLTQKIYKRMTVNVIVPSQTTPTFYIKGEVRSPGRLPYVNGMTMLTAIAAAGGPSDFFTPNMEILRGGKKIKVNYYDLEKHPEQDPPIQAGDIIIVYKSWL
jgi:polysaccharide export outer membrane protein